MDNFLSLAIIEGCIHAAAALLALRDTYMGITLKGSQ